MVFSVDGYFPFVDSPPWEMAHIECHMSMLKKNKSCYSAKEVEIIFKNYVNTHFPNYMHVYTDGSVKDSKAGAAACIPDLNLNIFAPLPINSSVLSAELFAVRLALDALSELGTSSRNVLFLSDSLSSIHLLNKINYQADDYDLKNIRQKIGYLFSMGCGISFLHIPSHKEIKYNEMADNLANKAAEIPLATNLRTKNYRDVVIARTNITYQRFLYPPFKSKDLNMIYYKLKTGTILLNADPFKWGIHHTPLCRKCFQTVENAQHVLFDCIPGDNDSRRLRNYCHQLKIPLTFDALVNCSLSHELEAIIYRLMISILKRRHYY